MIMTMTKIDVFEDGLILSGIGVSLANIQTVLSIVLLVINLLWLSFKFLSKLGKFISDGKLTDDEIKELDEDFNAISEVLENEKDKTDKDK